VDRRVRRATRERWTALEEITSRARATLSALLARRHNQTSAGGWRELMLQHQVDATGRCPICSGWLRRRRWPCEVWVTAHRHLIGDSSALADRPIRNSNRFCRPRQVVVVPRQPDAPAIEQAAADKSAARRATGTGKASIQRA
jgi:hypothetical protein